jgi:hypothetical protein
VVDALTAEHPDFRIQGNEWGKQYVSKKLAGPCGAEIQAMTRYWVGGGA